MIFRRGQWPTVATLAAIALIGFLLQPVTVLRVATGDDDAMLGCRRMDSASTVTLVFTHSMYGGEVREMWRANGSTLVRAGFETDNAAAAEYYAYDGRVERTDSGFSVIAPPVTTSALTIRVDQVGDHRVRFDTEEISLADKVDGSVAATMSAEQVPLFAWLLGRGC